MIYYPKLLALSLIVARFGSPLGTPSPRLKRIFMFIGWAVQQKKIILACRWRYNTILSLLKIEITFSLVYADRKTFILRHRKPKRNFMCLRRLFINTTVQFINGDNESAFHATKLSNALPLITPIELITLDFISLPPPPSIFILLSPNPNVFIFYECRNPLGFQSNTRIRMYFRNHRAVC